MSQTPTTTSLRAAAERVIAAFRARGEATTFDVCVKTQHECEAAMLALDKAVSTPHAEGWVLVPRRATPEMIGEGARAARHSEIDAYRLRNIYDAMIAAIPESTP
jgi:hypothetical protein